MDDMIDCLNSINNKIRFTIKIEALHRLNFLDITIDRQAAQFKYEIYRKQINFNTIIPAQRTKGTRTHE